MAVKKKKNKKGERASNREYRNVGVKTWTRRAIGQRNV